MTTGVSVETLPAKGNRAAAVVEGERESLETVRESSRSVQ